MKIIRALSVALVVGSVMVGSRAQSQPEALARVSDSWQSREVERDGERSIITIAWPLPAREVRMNFPYRVMLVYEYDREGSHRLPNGPEKARITSYETAIRSALARDGFGVAVVSMASDGLYQLVVYAKQPGEARLVTSLPKEERVSGQPLVVLHYTSELDPTWSYVSGLSTLIKDLKLEQGK